MWRGVVEGEGEGRGKEEGVWRGVVEGEGEEEGGRGMEGGGGREVCAPLRYPLHPLLSSSSVGECCFLTVEGGREGGSGGG